MKKFFKIVRYIFPYWFLVGLNVIFNMLSAIFALFSFTMAMPFLGILFKNLPRVKTKVPFELTAESIEHNLSYFVSQIITEHGQGKTLLFICVLVVVITFLKTFFKYLANYYITPVRTGTIRDIRNDIYDKILKLPLSYYSDARKGDVISRITSDVQEIELSIMSSLEMFFRDPLTILIFMSSMFIMSFHLTLFVLILLPISGFLIGRIGRKLRSTSLKGQKKMGLILSIVEETLSGLKIIKAFNAKDKVTRKFRSVNNFFTVIMNKVHRRRYLANPLSEFLATVVLMFLMWYGGTLVLNEVSSLSSQAFIVYLIIFSQVIVPAKGISAAYFNIQKGMASSDRIDDIMDAEITIKEKSDPIPISELKSFIEFKNVSFRYDTEKVLKNINLKIEKGKTIALVGKSGAGKSTLVDLLPRFIDVIQGDIIIDGYSVKDYKISDLRQIIGIVTQQSILFNDTFFNNIAFGIHNPNEEDVIVAAKVANAHEFIMETKNGYYSNVGDAGNKLSGGQRQRISIARAVLKNPPILIMDEATSALDTESERLVQEAIINLMKNRTSIVIAHRLSTVKYVDEIIVLHEGKVVERGKHAELLAKNGIYKKLHELQIY